MVAIIRYRAQVTEEKDLQTQCSLHILLINLAPKVLRYSFHYLTLMGLASLVAHNAGDLGLIPGLGRFPGEGNSNLLQYFCLKNSTDRGAWWAVHEWQRVG